MAAAEHAAAPYLGDDCDDCHVVSLLQALHLNLSITGDSLMSQVFHGLECELRRRGYALLSRGMEKRKQENRRFGVRWTRSYSLEGGPHIHFFMQYKPKGDMEEMDEIISSAGVLLLNFGLHWLRRDEYKRDMARLARHLYKRRDRLDLLLWRETSAQHFPTPGGEWPSTRKSQGCVPLSFQNASEGQHQWREKVFRSEAEDSGFTLALVNESARVRAAAELAWLPFYDFTAGLPWLHGKSNDCTHYCSTPPLWAPLWRGLRVALERLRARRHAFPAP